MPGTRTLVAAKTICGRGVSQRCVRPCLRRRRRRRAGQRHRVSGAGNLCGIISTAETAATFRSTRSLSGTARRSATSASDIDGFNRVVLDSATPIAHRSASCRPAGSPASPGALFPTTSSTRSIRGDERRSLVVGGGGGNPSMSEPCLRLKGDSALRRPPSGGRRVRTVHSLAFADAAAAWGILDALYAGRKTGYPYLVT